MTVKVYNVPIEITDKNIRVFKKMHNVDIDSTDVEMYLDANYHMKPEELISTLSVEDLSIAVNSCIQKEAEECYSPEFYKET